MKPFTPKTPLRGGPPVISHSLDHNSPSCAEPPKLSAIRQALHSDAWEQNTEPASTSALQDFRRCRRFVAMGRPTPYAHRRFDRKSWKPASVPSPRRRSLHHHPFFALGKQIPLSPRHFDAHPDLYGDYEGNPHSPPARSRESWKSKSSHRLIQIGIRTLNAHQYEQAEKYGVKISK